MNLPFVTLTSILFGTLVISSPLGIKKRQNCKDLAPPGNFKAFDLGECTAQLSFNKDRYISVQWVFEATYADGSRATHVPYRDFDTFGVSDPFYPYLGNNFITRYPRNSAFTAIHEFTNVCKSGQAPVSWRFYTATGNNPSCTGTDSYSSGQIRVVGGVSRPAQVSGISIRRVNDAGEFRVTWSTVPRVAAYSVIVEYPTGRDEIGRPYLNVRGARVPAGDLNTIIPTTSRQQDVIRRAIVHAVDAQGVWSFTNNATITVGNW